MDMDMDKVLTTGLVTLRNDIHRRAVNIRPSMGHISDAILRQTIKALCGVEGCTCGGISGPQDVEVRIIRRRDGSTSGADLFVK